MEEMVTSDDELHLIGMAKDGEEACHLIKEKEPDVVLLDIIMPKLDGLAVLDRIRADHTLKNRPTFLMISGISNEVLLLSLQWDRSGLQKMHLIWGRIITL